MKNFFKPLFIACGLIFAATTFTSCADDNSGLEQQEPDPGTTPAKTYSLDVNASNLNPITEVEVATVNAIQDVNVNFSGADNGMRRLYITKNDGTGRVIYKINDYIAPAVSLNEDGSIDLSKDSKETIAFTIPFEGPATKDGAVVYKLWATRSGLLSSKGDIENVEFRNAFENVAVGTVIVKVGENTSFSTITGNFPVTEFTAQLGNQIQLFAPDKEGKTKTFVSVLTGQTYKITQQQKDATNANVTFTADEQFENAEFVSYWDFGYYATSTKSNFASAQEFTSAFPYIDIKKISGLESSQLNSFFFKKSTLDFNAVSVNSDLDVVSATSQKIEDVKEEDVIEFVDGKTGAKGLIKIDNIKPGYDNDDYIQFSVKVQSVDYIKG